MVGKGNKYLCYKIVIFCINSNLDTTYLPNPAYGVFIFRRIVLQNICNSRGEHFCSCWLVVPKQSLSCCETFCGTNSSFKDYISRFLMRNYKVFWPELEMRKLYNSTNHIVLEGIWEEKSVINSCPAILVLDSFRSILISLISPIAMQVSAFW